MEIRILTISNVDNGKTSCVATLTHDVLDDGKGSARKLVLYHPHEQETGRTSSVTKTYKRLPNGNFLSFVDLAGHEKYLRTTTHGITAHRGDYAMLVVGANMGVQMMTKEHLSIVTSLKVPVYVVVTKIDICPENILKETLKDVEKLLKKTRRYQSLNRIENEEQAKEVIDLYEKKDFSVAPIFLISNKTGENLNLLRSFVDNLPIQTPYVENVEASNNVFQVNDKFLVKGVGIVVSGDVKEGIVKKGDVLNIGPITGLWYKITVKSIHNNFQTDVERLVQNESGCLAINFHDKKAKMTKSNIKKGVILSREMNKLTRCFRAKVMITTGHSTTVRIGYQPIINCKTIVQAAKVFKMDREILRGGELAELDLKFMFRSEFLNEGDIFIFREGNLRGIGKIVKLLEDNEYEGDRPETNKRVKRRLKRREKQQQQAGRGADEEKQ